MNKLNFDTIARKAGMSRIAIFKAIFGDNFAPQKAYYYQNKATSYSLDFLRELKKITVLSWNEIMEEKQ